MKAILQSLASVVGGEAAVRVANFAVVLFIARAYGGATLGAYTATLAMVTVVTMFADNGLQTVAITRVTSSARVVRNQIVGQLTLCKFVLLTAAATILAVVAISTRKSALLLALGFWIILRVILQSFSQLQMAFLKSISQAKWIGIIQALHSALLLLGIWLFFKYGWGVFALLEWLTACQLLELLLGVAVLYRNGIWPRWPEHLQLMAIVKMAAPFGLAYGLANLIVRADTIVLSLLAPLAEVGAFSAANAVLLVVYVSSWLFGSVLLPEMVGISNQPENVRIYANRWARWVLLVAAPCALALSIVAPRGIVLLYGSAFSVSGALGSVMALACPLILLNSIYTTLAIATNSRGTLLAIYGLGAIVTIGLDLFLGRAFGAMGIAIAIVAREAGMLLALWLVVSYLPSRRLNYSTHLLQEGIESNPPA
jgi:O-antigen/teichoic acid export membrane protein